MTVKCVSYDSFVSEPASAVMLQNCIIIERVADPACTPNEVDFPFLSERAAEANDTGGDRPLVQVFVAPNLVKQLAAGEDPTRMSHQEVKQPELENGQRDQTPGAPNLKTDWIEQNVGEVNLLAIGDKLGTASQGADPGRNFARIE